MTTDFIELAFDKARQAFESASDDVHALSLEFRTILLVHGAQGIIDNGGFQYFFESDWPGNSPYEDFIQAYEEIGCCKQAAVLRRAVNAFPFKEPHKNVDARNEYTDSNRGGAGIRGWSDSLCGDTEVWERLHEYCEENRKTIGI